MMITPSRKTIVIGLAAAGIIGFLAYAGDQYASFIDDMDALAKNHTGTVFIHGEIHGRPFQWITDVKVSTIVPGISIMESEPDSYALNFQGMNGNKAKLTFTVWGSNQTDQGGKGDKGTGAHEMRAMIWKAVIPSMAPSNLSGPIYSAMSEMRYLPNNPVSGATASKAGDRNELQAAWIGAPEALGDVH